MGKRLWPPTSQLPAANPKGDTPFAVGGGAGASVRAADLRPVTSAVQPPRTATLTELSAEYVLFNHAALCAVGNVPVDPVAAFWAERGLPDTDRPIMIDLRARVFNGIPAPFDRVLFGVRQTYWAGKTGLQLALDAVSGLHGGRYVQALHQLVPVVDLLAARRMTVIPANVPYVSAHLYGVDGTDACHHWRPGKNPLVDPIVLVKDAPLPETKEVARATGDIFGGRF